MAKYGYAGKLLRVDLSSGKIESVPTDQYADRFLGGRGIAAAIHWDEVPPEAGAFDERNRLTFALGPLAGVPVMAGSRWGVFGKSPLPEKEQFCYCNLGGRWGAELKFAGYDGLVFEGKSERPVCLSIQDGEVDIVDASHLWGRGAIETRDLLQREMGDSVKVVAIGPAGENMVTMASLMADGDASGSGGLGAVMGSKGLKAIAVKGSRKRIDIARPEMLRELTDYFRGMGRGNVPVWGVDFMVRGPSTKKYPCYGCPGDCLRIRYTAANGQSGKFMCQSRFFYLLWALTYYGEENEVPFHANRLCDEYGLDTWSMQYLLDWLERCFHAGIVTEESTGLPLSKIGSIEFMESAAKMISFREGFGDVLARGLGRAAKELGGEAEGMIRHMDAYEPRLYITNTLLFPFEPREPIQQLHEVGLTMGHWASWVKGSEGTYISTDVLRDIARKFWGGEAAADLTSYEGKALAARLIQDRGYAKESMMVCDWVYPILSISNSRAHTGDPDLESRVYSAVTGENMDAEGFRWIGERVFNLQRAILLREGHRALDDDRLPDEWHTMPLQAHPVDPDCIVPDGSGQVVSRKGAIVEWPDFERLRDEYYQLRGWDTATGLPTRETLRKLDLSDIADGLERSGFLA